MMTMKVAFEAVYSSEENTKKYKPTGEIRRPRQNEVFVNAITGNVHYGTPDDRIFNGSRIILKEIEPEVKEMTVAELQAELGYKIKIIE